MKKTMILLLLTGLCIQGQAQLRDVMMKKAGDKIKKNKTENTGTTSTSTPNTTTADPQKTETEQNNTPAPEQTNTTGNTGATPYNPYAGAQGGKKDIQPAYKFEQNMLMEMKSFDSKGKEKEKSSGKMRMHFSKEAYSGMESYDEKNVSRGFMIFETEKNQMVMLMDNDGKKIAMVRTTDPSKYADKNTGKGGESKTTITKTGRTKKVCGYNCEEWVSTDEKGEKTEMWISSDVPLKSAGMYSMFGSQNKDYGKHFGNSSAYPQGCMLEMTHYESNGEKFVMTTTEVNLNAPKTIETAGYQVF